VFEAAQTRPGFTTNMVCHASPERPAQTIHPTLRPFHMPTPMPTRPPVNRMRHPAAMVALSACLLALAACDKVPPTLPTPIVNQSVPAEAGATATTGANTSVPSAASVFPPAATAEVAPVLKPTDGVRHPEQASESAPLSLPLPGQNNDHSAPLSKDK
jgi:hypothetical protein